MKLPLKKIIETVFTLLKLLNTSNSVNSVIEALRGTACNSVKVSVHFFCETGIFPIFV